MTRPVHALALLSRTPELGPKAAVELDELIHHDMARSGELIVSEDNRGLFSPAAVQRLTTAAQAVISDMDETEKANLADFQ